MATTPSKWEQDLDVLQKSLPKKFSEYTRANIEAVRAAVEGRGPDSEKVQKNSGARMVCNIAAKHVPAFVLACVNGEEKPYKNAYDLGKFRLGDPPPGESQRTREIVDESLPLAPGDDPANLYFGALEINGTGVRFYGDICLVLKSEAVDSQTIILDRNSYDLVRSPIRQRVEASKPGSIDKSRLAEEARKISGEWEADLVSMAAIKVLTAHSQRDRRLTTGAISDGTLSDEDYIEILRIGSFTIEDVQEARLNAADSARDALISDRARIGFCPSLEELIWQDDRRSAEEFLETAGVKVRMITSSGRIRS